VIPTDIDRGAPAVVRIERMMVAAPEGLRQLQIGVADWPSWQRDIETATIEGPFAVGNIFTWATAGLAQPIVDAGTQVTTEESWAGAPVEANPTEARKMLEASLDRRLDFLASAAKSS
jgi:hypothetical protein